MTRLGFKKNRSKRSEGDSDSDDDRIASEARISSIRFIVRPEKVNTNCFSRTAVCLRENGSFEFYSDFNLVSVQKDLFCSEIETDSENYYFQIRYFTEDKVDRK